MIFMIMLADNEASATADNRAYLATVLRTSAQIPLRGTSDTLETSDCVKSDLNSPSSPVQHKSKFRLHNTILLRPNKTPQIIKKKGRIYITKQESILSVPLY